MKWYHNDYSQEALEEMQKEAEKRVQESRERARLLSGAAFPQAAQAAPPQAKPPENHSPPQNRQQQGSGGFAPQQCPPLFQQLFSPPNQQPCPPQQCNARRLCKIHFPHFRKCSAASAAISLLSSGCFGFFGTSTPIQSCSSRLYILCYSKKRIWRSVRRQILFVNPEG